MSLTIRLAGLALVLAAVACLANGGASAADDKPLAITAEQLAKEFKTDAAAAEKKYKGKTLVVEGKIHDQYDKKVTGEPSTILWGFQEKELAVPTLVQCTFIKEQQEKASKLKKDDKVKVQGKCEGTFATIFVVLKGCELAK